MPTSQTSPPQLDELQAYAATAGSDIRLVQGAGGNFSVKSGDVMWIKASGTRLVDALDARIFLPMRLEDTREAVLLTEDLSPLVIPDGSAPDLRPSIETSLHALLPHRVVLHVHSTGAIAAGLGEDPKNVLRTLPSWFDTALVPYAKPGIDLARAVFSRVGRQLSDSPLALLLMNHGLVAAAEDVATARRIVEAVQQTFATRSAPGGKAADVTTAGPSGWVALLPLGAVTSDEAALLRLGPLTPDEAVFLGPVPFTTRFDADPRSLAAVDEDGSVWIREGTGRDEAEIARSIVDVVRLLHGAAAVHLNDQQIDELVNWEAEIWRRRLRS